MTAQEAAGADGATAVAHARIAERMDRMRTAVEALLDPNQVLLPTPTRPPVCDAACAANGLDSLGLGGLA